MKRSLSKFLSFVAVACVMGLFLFTRTVAAQITGCCIGSVCANKTAQSCTASGGTALSSTCTASDDPRCNACSGLSGAPKGLCNAYCNAQDCPSGHNGQSCERLRQNWLRQTGQPIFPCDPVCCECPNDGRTCVTAQRCREAQCTIADRCINGQCPEPVCCECPTGGCGETTPDHCKSLGCVPQPGALCTSIGRCEQCPCGTPCKNAAGEGKCDVVPGGPTDQCVCVVPPECPCDTTTCTDANGQVGRCEPTATNPDVCTCVAPPPPPPCGLDPVLNTCGGTCPAGTACLACGAIPCPAPCACGVGHCEDSGGQCLADADCPTGDKCVL